MRHEGSLDCEMVWKGRTYTCRVAVLESEKRFGSTGRDITQINYINQSGDVNFIAPLPAVKGQFATMKLKPDAKLLFFVLGMSHLPHRIKSKRNITLEAQEIMESVELHGTIIRLTLV